MFGKQGIIFKDIFDVGIAQLVERCLAKAKVAGSNPVSHSSFILGIHSS